MSSTSHSIQRRLRTPPIGKFQVDGVKFLLQHHGRALLADEMGLGKTWQAIALLALKRRSRPAIVICPATLKWKWQRELLVHGGMRSSILEGRAPSADQLRGEMAKLPGGRGRARQRRWAKEQSAALRALRADVVIVNYDIVASWLPALSQVCQGGRAALVLDECHYVKSRAAKRTRACRTLSKLCQRVVAMSGTPVEGRPGELFSVLSMVRPDIFPSWWEYAMRYCDPKRGFGGSWDFSGSSHERELHRALRPVMLRRTKAEVLRDLPPKLPPEVVPVELENRAEYDEAEGDFLRWLLRTRGREAWSSARRAQAIVKLGQLRMLAGVGKLGAVRRWVGDHLEGTGEKLVAFAVHRVVLDTLASQFPGARRIDGSVPGRRRQAEVDIFQRDPRTRLILLQLRAGGEGIDLVAASTVLFAELGWTPGAHGQATDRTHRIGQTKPVRAVYLIGRGTIEERILELIQAKDDANARILDGKERGVMQLLDWFKKKAERGLK